MATSKLKVSLDEGHCSTFYNSCRILCQTPADIPFMSKTAMPIHVPRVAVAKESLPSVVEVNLSSSQFDAFAAALKSSPDEIPPMFACTSQLSVRGPAFKTITARQADCLPIEERLKLFPILSSTLLAAKQQWEIRNTRFVLKGSDDEELFYVEINHDFSDFEVFGPYERKYGIFSLPETAKESLLQFDYIESPAQPPQCGVTLALRFHARQTCYALPPLLGEVAIRLFSRLLRIHVLPHAALPNNVSRPLALNGVFSSNVKSKNQSIPKNRVNFVLHPTSCECFCRAWRNSPRAHQPGGPAERVCVGLEFCGSVLGSGMRECAMHGSQYVCESANGRLICTGGLTLSMQCKHGSGIGRCTKVPLPSHNLFLHALAMTSVDLCEECDSIDDSSSEEAFRLLDSKHMEFEARFQEDLSSSLIDEDELKRRDELVVAMLCEGNYCFGRKPYSRAGSASVLYLRDGWKNNVDSDLVQAARTHAHLLPSN
jgi:hypothetical protein